MRTGAVGHNSPDRAVVGTPRRVAERGASARRITRNTDGAVMIMGAFMAVFMVGILYHVTSLATAVAFREQLQDAADVAAYDAAVTHARSTNTIAVVNLSMFSQFTTLTAMNWTQFMYDDLAEGELIAMYGWVPGWRDGQRDRLLTSITAASDAAERLKTETPSLASARVNDLRDSAYGEGKLEDAVLIARPMPMTQSDMAPLCAWSGIYLQSYADEVALTMREFFFDPGFPPMVNRLLSSSEGCELPAGVGPQIFDEPNLTGTEPFQQRVVMIANARSVEAAARGVEVPARSQGLAYDAAEQPPNFALAQAEYYSAWEHANTLQADTVTEMPEQNAFFPHFRARLRRLRVPMDGSYDQLNDDAFTDWVNNVLAPVCHERCAGLSRIASQQNADVYH